MQGARRPGVRLDWAPYSPKLYNIGYLATPQPTGDSNWKTSVYIYKDKVGCSECLKLSLAINLDFKVCPREVVQLLPLPSNFQRGCFGLTYLANKGNFFFPPQRSYNSYMGQTMFPSLMVVAGSLGSLFIPSDQVSE